MRLVGLVLAVLLTATAARAQDRKWEIELYGGGVSTSASEGTRTLPPAGPPLVTTSPIFPSRAVPSFFFGDGANLLNGVTGEFDLSARIVPLDDTFAKLAGRTAASFGVRLRRWINRRVSAELAADFSPSSEAAPEGFEDAIESARQSFGPVFTGLLGSGPFGGLSIESTGSGVAGRQRETAVTAAANIHFSEHKSLVPYVTLGGGVVFASGTLPEASVDGRYRFTIGGEVPIAETDAVRLRFERASAFAMVAGGGVGRNLTKSLSLRVDARVFVGPDSTRIFVSTASSNTPGTPAGFIESFTNPGIQFSNDPATGRRSTLSGPALDGFQVFDGGMRTRAVLTVGVSRHF